LKDKDKTIHRGGAKVAKKDLLIWWLRPFWLRVLRDFAVHPFFLFLFFLPFLQGCSLLFVAQGKTSIASTRPPEAPQAISQVKKMDRTVVLHYQVQAGDTLEFIAEAFYGTASAKLKLARQNHLNSHKPLKLGKNLRIVNPVDFPDKGQLDHMRQKLKQVPAPPVASTPVGSGKYTQAFSGTDTAEDESDVEKVPRPRVNKAFAAGEKLTYEVRAIGVLGGYATLSVENYVTVLGRPCYPLVTKAKSAFPFSTFYPVNDVQTSYFDAVDYLTWKFENEVHEGNYNAHNLESYDQIKHRLVHQKNQDAVEEMDIQPYTQDIISCFYYFRLLPLEAGKKYLIPTSSGGKNYKLIIKVLDREKIKCPAGTFDCFHTKPFVKYGTVFRNKEDIDLWITADERHIPILIKSAIVIGDIEVSLLDAVVPDINGDGGKLISRISP
jgi:LysM repeat protein